MATEKRLIYASTLLRRICSERDEVEPKTGCDIGYHNGLNMAASMVINEPTVDAVEVVRGRWEPRTDVPGFVCCSVCRDCNIYDDWADGKKWNYCPNCGAKMDGGTDER